MVAVSIISGDAGTGKSVLLSKYVKKVVSNNASYYVLSFTHSAVNNIKNICSSQFEIDESRFLTIHKYFHINIINNKISYYNFKNIDYLFIDEYSFISKSLFAEIFPIIYNTVDKLVLCGDFKQLRTIDGENEISYDKILSYINNIGDINKNMVAPIKHFENSILSMEQINKNLLSFLQLTDNKRAATDINEYINNICFKSNSEEKIKEMIKNKIIDKKTLLNNIINKNFCFIASKYKCLQYVHNFIEDNCEKILNSQLKNKEHYTQYIIHNQINEDSPALKTLKLREGQKVRITETNIKNPNEMTNGEEMIFCAYNKENNYILLKELDSNIFHYMSPSEFDKNHFFFRFFFRFFNKIGKNILLSYFTQLFNNVSQSARIKHK